MLRRFRMLNRVFAFVAGFFWLPCPRCGEMFGGHESNLYAIEVVDGAHMVCCWRHPDDPESALQRLRKAPYPSDYRSDRADGTSTR